MRAAWAILIGLVGTLVGAAIGDMVNEEVRVRLERLPAAVIRLAGRRLSADVRHEWTDEWLAELSHILRGTEALPITRLVRGVGFAVSLLLRGAPAIDRELSARAIDTLRFVEYAYQEHRDYLAILPRLLEALPDTAYSAATLEKRFQWLLDERFQSLGDHPAAELDVLAQFARSSLGKGSRRQRRHGAKLLASIEGLRASDREYQAAARDFLKNHIIRLDAP